MEKINIAELLKSYPKGTKLYSTVWGDVYLNKINDATKYPISVTSVDNHTSHSLTSDGRLWTNYKGECLLFPSKDQRDWSKFVPPYKFKDGDIVATSSGAQVFILKRVENNGKGYCYIGYNLKYNELFTKGEWYFSRLATEEEKRKLFDAIKLNGYKWDAETKTLEKLEKPSFHEGDWVVNKFGDSWHIDSLDEKNYQVSDGKGNYNYFPISKQDEMRLWTIQDAKDSDVLALSWLEDENLWEKIIIFKKYHSEGVKGLYSMPCVEGYGNTFKNGKMAFTDEEVPYYSKTWTCNLHPATKEQREVLMKAINKAGYEWDKEKKELKKLVSNRFDPASLKPFDKVLGFFNGVWNCDLYSNCNNNKIFPYECFRSRVSWVIPYNDDTKHLVGTNEEAPEYYRYWED